MNEIARKNIQSRLSTIEGQVRGLMRMIEADRANQEVLIQLSSVRAALESVGTLVISELADGLVESSRREAKKRST
jgi:DNA-binding FrmR family transcriptional regulator